MRPSAAALAGHDTFRPMIPPDVLLIHSFIVGNCDLMLITDVTHYSSTCSQPVAVFENSPLEEVGFKSSERLVNSKSATLVSEDRAHILFDPK